MFINALSIKLLPGFSNISFDIVLHLWFSRLSALFPNNSTILLYDISLRDFECKTKKNKQIKNVLLISIGILNVKHFSFSLKVFQNNV